MTLWKLLFVQRPQYSIFVFFVRFGHVYSNVKFNHFSTDINQTLRSCFGQTEPTTDKVDIVARNHLSGCSNQDIWRESAPATIAGSRCIEYDNSEYYLGKCRYLAVLWDLTILAEVSLCGVFSSQRVCGSLFCYVLLLRPVLALLEGV